MIPCNQGKVAITRISHTTIVEGAAMCKLSHLAVMDLTTTRCHHLLLTTRCHHTLAPNPEGTGMVRSAHTNKPLTQPGINVTIIHL